MISDEAIRAALERNARAVAHAEYLASIEPWRAELLAFRKRRG